MAQIETPSDVSAVTPGVSDIQTFSENDRPTFTSTVTVYVSVARTVTYLKRGWYVAGVCMDTGSDTRRMCNKS